MSKRLTIPLNDRTPIKAAVRRAYAARALGASDPSCCGPSAAHALYDAPLLQDMPDTVL